MRSFCLLLLFCLSSLAFTAQASFSVGSQTEQMESFFKVTLPYEGESSVNQTLVEAMAILLVRLTGQKQFINSRVAKAYLKNPRAWLKTYNIVPRTEEGVLIGKNIVYTFLGDKLRQEFHQRFVPIWPMHLRPKTWVLGSLEQGGTVVQLNDETLLYRVDAEFRDYPKKIRLPISLPLSTWSFPEDSKKIATVVQTILAKRNQDYLLRFQVQMKGDKKNRLTWSLYDVEGHPVVLGELLGGQISALTEQMFNQVMAYYVELGELGTHHNRVVLEPILLTIHNIMNVQKMTEFEKLLKSKPDMIRSVELVSMQAGRVQYRIVPQMTYQKVVDWIESWPQTVFNRKKSKNRMIHLDMNSDDF